MENRHHQILIEILPVFIAHVLKAGLQVMFDRARYLLAREDQLVTQFLQRRIGKDYEKHREWLVQRLFFVETIQLFAFDGSWWSENKLAAPIEDGRAGLTEN